MITSTVAILFAVGYLLATVWLCRGLKLNARNLAMGGLACALTLILGSIMIPLPTGASITCGSWLPLMLLAVVCDSRLAFVSGWVCGILAVDPGVAAGPLGTDLRGAFGVLLMPGLHRYFRHG